MCARPTDPCTLCIWNFVHGLLVKKQQLVSLLFGRVGLHGTIGQYEGGALGDNFQPQKH